MKTMGGPNGRQQNMNSFYPSRLNRATTAQSGGFMMPSSHNRILSAQQQKFIVQDMKMSGMSNAFLTPLTSQQRSYQELQKFTKPKDLFPRTNSASPLINELMNTNLPNPLMTSPYNQKLRLAPK